MKLNLSRQPIILVGDQILPFNCLPPQDELDDSKYLGHLFGLGMNPVGDTKSTECAAKTES